MKVRAVFDCMIFLQGAARPDGPAAACLRLAEAGGVDLCLSEAVLAEVRDVLTRPKIRQCFPALTDELVNGFLDRVRLHASVLSEVPSTISYPRDPKDEKYLNLAVAAQAAYLVSRDNDLLDLMNAGQEDTFRTRYPMIAILDPVAFLRITDAQTSETSRADPGPSPASG